ncbi:MAG: pyridoxine 5'-phosphate synthase [Bacteroidetes bacterium]|nr:pyridoxine 5'-phosphate synthase [Bacteroidota bacterium]MBS1629063.1 pyridoxine 5'-phosphate synthase [Bacteroidota bacterium]
MAARLSVNINKIATLRNSRGGTIPDVLLAAQRCEAYGADGITIHPRPDERHIRYADARALKQRVTTEFNIEGNPKEESFVALVLELKPTQVTLVPDARGQLTSNHGWDTVKEQKFLQEIIKVFAQAGIRTSIFVNPDAEIIRAAVDTGTHRIELYTEAYAQGFSSQPEEAVKPYVHASELAHQLGLGINAGHDLNLDNLSFFAQRLPTLDEVSIGHALISDALYFGLENTVQMYKRCLTTQ